MFRSALRLVLETEAGVSVVAEAGDGNEAVRCVAEHQPDVLLLDLEMPRATGLDALRQIQQANARVRTVILTAAISNTDVVTALTLGAYGVVLKDISASSLCDCVRSVARGKHWIGHEHLRDLVGALREFPATAPPPTPAETLTPRELEIVAAVLDGATNRDIATGLSVSAQTVKNHLSHVFNKLGVSSRLELALYATHHRLLHGVAKGSGL
jgi:two-component system, NarL family, nitrate/nitrite response regulator NarL